jgi:hypothetical protein
MSIAIVGLNIGPNLELKLSRQQREKFELWKSGHSDIIQ